MIVEASIEPCKDVLQEWHQTGQTIGLVPTMGYFHDGHLGLMEKAGEISDRVVVSLFVNPTQFGAQEDLGVYPRDFEGDCRKAEQAGVDLIFCPDTEMMYTENHETFVRVKELTAGMCGRDRPVHFQGVTTIVAKLFNIIQPEYAVFGEKDFQQLTVIRRMVSDLDFPVKVLGHPIVREKDGLALSSRNAYLSPEERKSATILYRTMKTTRNEILAAEGTIDLAALLVRARALIESQKDCSLDYFTIVEEESLAEREDFYGQCRIMGAINVNERIRLIDNLPLY